MSTELAEAVLMDKAVPIGTHVFEADDIKRFAARYDPQPFHLDEDKARHSVFGGLCASGWHVCSVWMKLNVASLSAQRDKAIAQGQPFPEFGPSPGVRDLQWKLPVFAGEEIAFFTRSTGLKTRPSGNGFHLLTGEAWAQKADGALAMRFGTAVLVRLARP